MTKDKGDTDSAPQKSLNEYIFSIIVAFFATFVSAIKTLLIGNSETKRPLLQSNDKKSSETSEAPTSPVVAKPPASRPVLKVASEHSEKDETKSLSSCDSKDKNKVKFQFVDDDTGEINEVSEKRGKKASETAEQRAKRLERQRAAKAAKKLAEEQEAQERKRAEEEILRATFLEDEEERLRLEEAQRKKEEEEWVSSDKKSKAEAKAESKAKSPDSSTGKGQKASKTAKATELKADANTSPVRGARADREQQQNDGNGTGPAQNRNTATLKNALGITLAGSAEVPAQPSSAIPLPGSGYAQNPVSVQSNDLYQHGAEKPALSFMQSGISALQSFPDNIIPLSALHAPASHINHSSHPPGLPDPTAGIFGLQGAPGLHSLSPPLGLGLGLGGFNNAAPVPSITPSGPAAVPEAVMMIQAVGGELLAWTESFRMKFRYVSRLGSPASVLDSRATLIYSFEFPAGSAPFVVGEQKEKLQILGDMSGCIVSAFFEGDDIAHAKAPGPSNSAWRMKPGALSITGTVVSVSTFVRLLDTHLLSSIDGLQRLRAQAPNGLVQPLSQPHAQTKATSDISRGWESPETAPKILKRPDAKLESTTASTVTDELQALRRILNVGATGAAAAPEIVIGQHSASSPTKRTRDDKRSGGATTTTTGAHREKDTSRWEHSKAGKGDRDDRAQSHSQTQGPARGDERNANRGQSKGHGRDAETKKSGDEVSVYFEVPAEHTGYIIGKKGVIIKYLMKVTGAHISIVHNPMEGSKGDGENEGGASAGAGAGASATGAARFVVKGSSESVQAALTQITSNLEKIDQRMVVVSGKD